LDQPATIRPNADEVLSKAVGREGAGSDAGTACAGIFSQGTVALFGSGFQCYVMSSIEIYVLFGHEALVMAGSRGSLHAGMRAHEPLAAVAEGEVSFEILGLRGRELELAGSLVGPAEIGPCEAATIELLLVSRHPPAVTEWSITTSNLDMQDTAEMQTLRELVAKESGISITLRPEDIPVLYMDFAIHIRVVTNLGKTGVFSHQLSRTGWPIPAVQLRSSRFFSTVEAMRVEVEARPSRCLDVAAQGPANAELHYSWELTNENSTQALDYKGSDIIHWQYDAPPRGTRQRHVAVEVFSSGDPISIAKVGVALRFRPAPLIAAIEAGDRAIAVEEDLLLSVHGPADRDYPALELHYRWECFDENHAACRRSDGSLLLLPSETHVLVLANSLLPGKLYTFHLTVTSSDGRIATAQSRIAAWSGEVNSLEVMLSQDATALKCGLDTVNTPSKAILTSMADAAHPSEVAWSLQWPEAEYDPAGAPDLYAQQTDLGVLGGQTSPVLSLTELEYLGIPGPYDLVAASPNARSWCPIQVNLPPRAGSCSAHIISGSQVFNDVTVRCSGFHDSQAPLSYSVGILVDGRETYFKPSYHSNQTMAVFQGISSLVVRIEDSAGSWRELATPIVPQNAVGHASGLDEEVISKTLEGAITEDAVQRSIINVVLFARNLSQPYYSNVSALAPNQETLLKTLIARMQSMVQAAPPSPDLGMRVMQTLLAISKLPVPLAGLRGAMTEILLLILHPDSLPSRILSEAELRQCASVLSNIYSQDETCDRDSGERYRFAAAMEALGEALGKAALNNVPQRSPEVEVEEERLIMGLRKVPSAALAGAELNFPIPDGTTVSMVLPALLPPQLSVPGTADVHMVQHRDQWGCGSDASREQLLSFPTSLSASLAGAKLGALAFGQEEVFVTLPFNASALPATDIERVYRREGIACLTWQGHDADVQDPQPWSTTGCRVDSVRMAQDEAGREAFGLGAVVCACSHMSTFALSFREEPTRFEDPTPHYGDLLYITAGHLLQFPVRAVGQGVNSVRVENLAAQPASRSFRNAILSPAQPSSQQPHQHLAGAQVVEANVSWTPMEPGSYTLTLSLLADDKLVETREWRVVVLFCQHYVRHGDTLHSVANAYGTSWQGLFSINPQLAQLPDLSLQRNVRYGRLWSCDPPLHAMRGAGVTSQTEDEEVEELFDHRCKVVVADRQPLGDLTLNVGLVLGPLQEAQNVPALVRNVSASLRQTLAMNPSRIDVISEHPLVADMMHPHGDRRLCVVSSWSDECPAVPY